MLAEGLITSAELGRIETEVDILVRQAVIFAEESPYPEPQEALEDVFVS
jgi:pyruvate dehydrogenase E1 component alpha subunit